MPWVSKSSVMTLGGLGDIALLPFFLFPFDSGEAMLFSSLRGLMLCSELFAKNAFPLCRDTRAHIRVGLPCSSFADRRSTPRINFWVSLAVGNFQAMFFDVASATKSLKIREIFIVGIIPVFVMNYKPSFRGAALALNFLDVACPAPAPRGFRIPKRHECSLKKEEPPAVGSSSVLWTRTCACPSQRGQAWWPLGEQGGQRASSWQRHEERELLPRQPQRLGKACGVPAGCLRASR